MSISVPLKDMSYTAFNTRTCTNIFLINVRAKEVDYKPKANRSRNKCTRILTLKYIIIASINTTCIFTKKQQKQRSLQIKISKRTSLSGKEKLKKIKNFLLIVMTSKGLTGP